MADATGLKHGGGQVLEPTDEQKQRLEQAHVDLSFTAWLLNYFMPILWKESQQKLRALWETCEQIKRENNWPPATIYDADSRKFSVACEPAAKIDAAEHSAGRYGTN